MRNAECGNCSNCSNCSNWVRLDIHQLTGGEKHSDPISSHFLFAIFFNGI